MRLVCIFLSIYERWFMYISLHVEDKLTLFHFFSEDTMIRKEKKLNITVS